MRALAEQTWSRVREWGPERCLLALLGALVLLHAVQGFRFGVNALAMHSATRSLRHAAEDPPLRNAHKSVEDYDSILEKGILGKVAKAEGKKEEAKPAINLYGIMGNQALMGMSMKDAKCYAQGAQVPGGETLAKVGVDEVVLEKDGEKRTIPVFPDRFARISKPDAPPPPPTPTEERREQPTAVVAEAPQPEAAQQAPVQAAAPFQYTYETLVNTRWQSDYGTVTLGEGGKLIIEGTEVGTWRVEGNTIYVNAMGEDVQIEIKGSDIYFEGKKLTKVE